MVVLQKRISQFFNSQVIAQYQERLKQLNGLLILDEAFIDVISGNESYCNQYANQLDEQTGGQLTNQIESSHSLVLRSFGKFFGLAGIRIGFLVANSYWCGAFKELLGTWQINGPAQLIAHHALQDTRWQATQRETLSRLRMAQEHMLMQAFSQTILQDIKGCDLFLTLSFHQQD